MSCTEIPFLDVLVYKTQDLSLKTTIYKKATDNKQYLHYKSCHSRYMKNAIPDSLLIRAKRICSDNLDYMREANKIMTILHQRQYPSHVLQLAILRAHEIPRKKLFENFTQKEDKKIRYIITYNPRNPPINSIIEQNAHYLLTKKFPLKFEDI